MEQLVEERRMEHENISDIFQDRDNDIKHFPEGMDRQALANGVHHLHEQVESFSFF